MPRVDKIAVGPRSRLVPKLQSRSPILHSLAQHPLAMAVGRVFGATSKAKHTIIPLVVPSDGS